MTEEALEESGSTAEAEEVLLTQGAPRRFTLGWKLFGNLAGIALGLVPVIPILAFCVLLGIGVHPVLGLLAVPVFLIAYLLVYLFIISPFFSYMMARRMVEANHPEAIQQPDAFMVQVSLSPRLCRGIGQALDDADDIGVLFVRKDHLEFTGDSAQLRIPFSCIRRMILDLPSPFRLFLGGRRVELLFRPGGKFKEMMIDNRAGKTVFSDITLARRLAAAVQRGIEDWMLEANLPESERPQLPAKRPPA